MNAKWRGTSHLSSSARSRLLSLAASWFSKDSQRRRRKFFFPFLQVSLSFALGHLSRTDTGRHGGLNRSFLGWGTFSSLPPSSWSNSTTTGKEAKFPSLVFANQLPSPAKKTEQAAINYKEILSCCGRFAATPVSKANRYGVLGSLVPCTAAMPNPSPTDPLTAHQRVSKGGGCYHALCSITIHISSSLPDSKTDRKAACISGFVVFPSVVFPICSKRK